MSRGDRFSIGIALMSAALAELVKKDFWLYLVFGIGIAFIVVPLLMDWIFGKNRPSFAEIEAMPSETYKPLYKSPTARRWIHLVDWWNGY